MIENAIEEQEANSHQILAVRLDKEHSINRNLTGLCANVIMGKYQKPTLILSETDNGWEGSARGLSNSQFDTFKDFLDTSGLVLYAQGHEQAFGIGIQDVQFGDLMSYCDKELANFDFSPCFKVDFIYEAKSV